MAQLGFGLDTNTTAMESGYDQFQKKDDFEFTPLSIVLAAAIIVAIFFFKKGISPPKDNRSSSIDNLNLTDGNKQGFFDNKVINEHIKLLNQNLFAISFLKSGYEKISNFRASAELNDMWTQTDTALADFLQRDLTEEEIKNEFETNMFVRRAYDDLKVTAELGKFDKVMNPEYHGNGNWEAIINECREQMTWIN